MRNDVLFRSGEMSRARLASRELASSSGVTPIKMRRDDLLTEEDFASRLCFTSVQGMPDS
jgi:hypothetical protein